MAHPVPAEDLPDGVVCVLGVAGSLGERERQHIAWFAEFLGADHAATTPEQHAEALAAYQAHYDAAPTDLTCPHCRRPFVPSTGDVIDDRHRKAMAAHVASCIDAVPDVTD